MASANPTCPKCGTGEMRPHDRAYTGGRQRWKCRACGYKTANPAGAVRVPTGKLAEVKPPMVKHLADGYERIVITYAQNATPVHEGFWNTLRNYCRRNRARLVVIPGRYKNPTSIWSRDAQSDDWWAKEVMPYIVNQRKKVCEHLMLLADIHVQPTAVRPLSGFESMTHGESGIVGHPKLQMDVIPTPHQRLPKIMTTTGACTVQNYTDTKAGKKGDFHHVFGAVLIETDGPKFHMRHLNARSDGAFCDLDRAYFPDGTVQSAGPYQGLVLGDAHPQFADPSVVRATFGASGLVERLDPKTLVFHDLLDSYAVNPHHEKNPFINYSKMEQGQNNIRREVQDTILWLRDVCKGRKAVVVPSNHDDMLTRWIKNADWKEQGVNQHFYIQTALYMLEHVHTVPGCTIVPDPFKYWVDRAQLPNVTCLNRNTSFTIAGIECGLHGHEGPNGARGNRSNLSKIGAKTIIGHSHTPGITEGCYQAGTMTFLQLEYTGPVSSWLNAHVSIDPFGKRHIHICVEGRFWKGQK